MGFGGGVRHQVLAALHVYLIVHLGIRSLESLDAQPVLCLVHVDEDGDVLARQKHDQGGRSVAEAHEG